MNRKLPETTYGLIAGRHDLPVCGYIFDSVENVMDFDGIRKQVARFIGEHCNIRSEYRPAINQADDTSCLVFTGDPLNVIVTGLTAVTAELIKLSAYNGVPLTLWHFDRDSGNYKPQDFWF